MKQNFLEGESLTLSLMKFQVTYLAVFLLFFSNRQLQLVLDGKSSQEYPVNAGVPQVCILGPTPFLLYINDLPDDLSVILLSMLIILLSIQSVFRHLISGNN